VCLLAVGFFKIIGMAYDFFQKVDIIVFESCPDGSEQRHSLMLPIWLIPVVGDQIYLARDTPLICFEVTSRKLVFFQDSEFYTVLTVRKVDSNESYYKR